MAVTGAHVVLYTSDPEALRATLRGVFGWRHVDAADGWLIFALPPAEVGVHPAQGPPFPSGVRHQLTLMCELLSGLEVMLYEPRHPVAISSTAT